MTEKLFTGMLRINRPRPSGLGEIDGLHGTSTQSCILTYDLCTGEPLRRPKPAQDEWYVIMSGHPFIKALAAYWGGASVQGLRCHFISMPGKSPMKLEVTSRHDHSCLLGRKASNKQTNNQPTNQPLENYATYMSVLYEGDSICNEIALITPPTHSLEL